MNEYQQARFVSNMVQSMFNTVAGKRIVLLGAAFKANTNDTRESPALKSGPRLSLTIPTLWTMLAPTWAMLRSR
jgi:UDPglucose 6-dehydrogenase